MLETLGVGAPWREVRSQAHTLKGDTLEAQMFPVSLHPWLLELATSHVSHPAMVHGLTTGP